MFTWQEGRQASGYQKLLLAGWSPFFDLWLLRYPEGAHIARHQDEVTGRRHYRFNLVLKKARRGGDFKCGSFYRVGRLVAFRPDKHWHEVSLVEEGTRFVLSLGVSLPGRTTDAHWETRSR